MVDWRSFRIKLIFLWNNFRQSTEPYRNYDYDRCLDLIMIGAGIRPVPGVERWKRNCLILYRLLGFYQFVISIAKLVFSVRNGNDTFRICASFAITVTLTTIYAKVYGCERYYEVIRQTKIFINSNFSYSGDPDYDTVVRRSHAGVAGKVTLIIFVILCGDQVVLWIPNAVWDNIYGIPAEFHVFGAMSARLLQAMYVFTLYIFWGCGYFSCALMVMPLLNGLKRELLIIAHGYKRIAEREQAHTLNYQDNAMMLRHLKQKLQITTEQHVEALRIIHQVQPLVSYLYAITYYSVMIVASLMVFVVIRSEITLTVIVVLGSTGILLIVECYLWCRITDSIEETMEMIADSVAPLGFGLQHSLDNHSEYIGMRTSVMIVQLNASQSGSFSCAGIFLISVESFGNLCMIIYKFATFLLEVE